MPADARPRGAGTPCTSRPGPAARTSWLSERQPGGRSPSAPRIPRTGSAWAARSAATSLSRNVRSGRYAGPRSDERAGGDLLVRVGARPGRGRDSGRRRAGEAPPAGRRRRAGPRGAGASRRCPARATNRRASAVAAISRPNGSASEIAARRFSAGVMTAALVRGVTISTSSGRMDGARSAPNASAAWRYSVPA